jgi:hypothetical protein
MGWYWVALVAGVILPWVIKGKLIRIGLEDGGLSSGLRVWAKLCLFTIPLMFLTVYIVGLVADWQ